MPIYSNYYLFNELMRRKIMTKHRMRRILSIMLVVCFFISNSAVLALAETIQQEHKWNRILNAFSEDEKNSLDKPVNYTNKSEIVESPKDAYTENGEYVTDRFIIKYKENIRTLSQVESEGKRVRAEIADFKYRAQSVDFVEGEGLVVISTTREMAADELLASVEGRAVENDILYIQPDGAMPMASTDSLAKRQWGHGWNLIILGEMAMDSTKILHATNKSFCDIPIAVSNMPINMIAKRLAIYYDQQKLTVEALPPDRHIVLQEYDLDSGATIFEYT